MQSAVNAIQPFKKGGWEVIKNSLELRESGHELVSEKNGICFAVSTGYMQRDSEKCGFRPQI